MFPNQRGVKPRYDQITLETDKTKNNLYQILSPFKEDEGVWVHQNAWFHMGELEKGCQETYEIKNDGNGVYVFVLEGQIKIGDQDLSKRDGFGVWDTKAIEIQASSDAKVLLMDVPMALNG